MSLGGISYGQEQHEGPFRGKRRRERHLLITQFRSLRCTRYLAACVLHDISFISQLCGLYGLMCKARHMSVGQRVLILCVFMLPVVYCFDVLMLLFPDCRLAVSIRKVL
jgi:hypothetical protein